MVGSWTWAAVVQILNTLLPLAEFDLDSFHESDSVLAEETKISKKPARVEELRNGSRTASPQREFETESLSRVSSQDPSQTNQPVGPRRPGVDRFHSTIAKLFLLARKTVENLPAVSTWLEEIRQIERNSMGSSKCPPTTTSPNAPCPPSYPLHPLSSTKSAWYCVGHT